MAPDELLGRLAVTMRHEVGPAVGDGFAKTQAFMAAVILEKLAGQLRLADAHRHAEALDLAALAADLDAGLAADTPPSLRSAVQRLREGTDADIDRAGDHAGDVLGSLVAALYQERRALGEERFAQLLDRVRATLRARVDRQLAYAA